jgi:hypothetical protein
MKNFRRFGPLCIVRSPYMTVIAIGLRVAYGTLFARAKKIDRVGNRRQAFEQTPEWKAACDRAAEREENWYGHLIR